MTNNYFIKDRGILLAHEWGFEIYKRGKSLLFVNRHTFPFMHLSWFFGVPAGVCFVGLLVEYLSGMTNPARTDVHIKMVITLVLLAVLVIPFIICLHQYFKRRRMPPGQWPIKYIADCERGVLLDAAGRELSALSDITVKIQTANSTLLSDDWNRYYSKVVLQSVSGKSVCVFKSEIEGNNLARVKKLLEAELLLSH